MEFSKDADMKAPRRFNTPLEAFLVFIFKKIKKEEMTMAIQRYFIGLAIASIFLMSTWPLGSVPQATAETLNFKILNQVTKMEMAPIADVEGHFMGLIVREGAIIIENGEFGWAKGTHTGDLIKGAGTMDVYSTFTLQDGSAITNHLKGTFEATSQGASSVAKWTGDIIHGTGRFQGIKGTITASTKFFPPGKGGDIGGKALVEGTLVYTLPSK